MPFEVGNTYGKRPKPNAGRPPKVKQEIKKAAAEIAREFIEENVKPVLANYLRLAEGYYDTRYSENGTPYEVFITDGPSTRHFVDKILPNEQAEQSRPLQINFINYHPVQLHSQVVSSTVLAGDGNGHDPSGKGVAPAIGQGQNGLKFHNFEDVS